MSRKTCRARRGPERGLKREASAEEGTERGREPGLRGDGGACGQRPNRLVCKGNAKQHSEEYSAFWPSLPVLRPAELRLPVAWPYSVTAWSCVQRGASGWWTRIYTRRFGSWVRRWGRRRLLGKKRPRRGNRVGAGLGHLPLHLCWIQKGLCPLDSQQGRDQGGGSSTLPGFVCKRNGLWLGGCPLPPSLGKTH